MLAYVGLYLSSPASALNPFLTVSELHKLVEMTMNISCVRLFSDSTAIYQQFGSPSNETAFCNVNYMIWPTCIPKIFKNVHATTAVVAFTNLTVQIWFIPDIVNFVPFYLKRIKYKTYVNLCFSMKKLHFTCLCYVHRWQYMKEITLLVLAYNQCVNF